MRGQYDLFGNPQMDKLRARVTDPPSSHVTMTLEDMSPKRVTKAQYALKVACEKGSVTAADVAFQASQDGIHPYPKPNFVAHWLEDCRSLGWLWRDEKTMRNRSMVHWPTDDGLAEYVPPRALMIERLIR